MCDEEKVPTKVLMKKFQVSIERSKDIELTVWAPDKDAARKAFKALSDSEIKEILDLVDPDVTISVSEAPGVDPEDGIVTPDGKWKDGKTTWTEGDEEYEPTADPLEALPQATQDTLAAERVGAQPLPGFTTLHEALGIPIKKEGT